MNAVGCFVLCAVLRPVVAVWDAVDHLRGVA